MWKLGIRLIKVWFLSYYRHVPAPNMCFLIKPTAKDLRHLNVQVSARSRDEYDIGVARDARSSTIDIRSYNCHQRVRMA